MAVGLPSKRITNISTSEFNKYKGWFTTIDSLRFNHPGATPGDFAFIGNLNRLAQWDFANNMWDFNSKLSDEQVQALQQSVSPSYSNTFVTKNQALKEAISRQNVSENDGSNLFTHSNEYIEFADGPADINFFIDEISDTQYISTGERVVLNFKQRSAGQTKITSVSFLNVTSYLSISQKGTISIPQENDAWWAIEFVIINKTGSVYNVQYKQVEALAASAIRTRLQSLAPGSRLSTAFLDEATDKKFVSDSEKTKINALKANYKGYFANPTALTAAFPTALQDDWAIVQSTGTIWFWNSGGTPAWEDTNKAADITIINALNNTSTDQALSAAQGKVLKDLIDALNLSNIAETETYKRFTISDKQKLDSIVVNYQGYFTDEAALVTAHPTGQAGWWAINYGTNTVWIWDTGTNEWIDTLSAAPSVEVVNVLTDTSTNKALSAAQGKVLKDYIDQVNEKTDSIPIWKIVEDEDNILFTPEERVELSRLSSAFKGAFANPTILSDEYPAPGSPAYALVYATWTFWVYNGVSQEWEDTNKPADVEIINVLNDTSTDKALSAAQGKVLKDLIDALNLSDVAETETLKQFTITEKNKLASLKTNFKGYYTTIAALFVAHPTAAAEDWAIVQETGTIWFWNSGGTPAWEDTNKTSGDITLSYDEDTNEVNLLVADVVIDTISLTATGDGAIVPPAISKSANYAIQDVQTLSLLPSETLANNEVRLVVAESAIYYYNALATEGDVEPEDQTEGTGYWIKLVGFEIITSAIENAGTVAESATLDFSESDMFTMPLSSNLDITAITGLSAIGIVKFVHNGFALTINTSLIPANKNAGFVDRGGAYYVRFTNHSVTETPDYTCGDLYGNPDNAGSVADTALGDFTGEGITISENGYYNEYTVSGNLELTFAITGHVEGKAHTVKMNFDGTDTLTVIKPSGLLLNLIHAGELSNGDIVPEGSYLITFKYKGSQLYCMVSKQIELIAVAMESWTLGTNVDLIQASSTNSSRRLFKIKPAGNGKIDSITFKHASASGNAIVGVYADNDGEPGALLGLSASEAAATSGQEWTTHELTTPLDVVANEWIWIAFMMSASTTYEYLGATYGISRYGNSTFGMPDPQGSVTNSSTFIYCAYANVRYEPETYAFVINDDFEDDWDGELPYGWSYNGTPDANNYVEKVAGGLRIVIDGSSSFGIKKNVLTNAQQYHLEAGIHSVASGAVKEQGGSTVHGIFGRVGRMTVIFTSDSLDCRFIRNASTAVDMVIKTVRVW